MFHKMCKSWAVNIVFAILLAIAIALPVSLLSATPAAAQAAVEVNVAPAYFAGQTAEIYILTTSDGMPADVTIDRVIVYFAQGEQSEDLTADVEHFGTGLYVVRYHIPDGAPVGAYNVVVETEAGTSSGIFQVIGIPWLPVALPMWAWALIAVAVVFILMIIAVRIAR